MHSTDPRAYMELVRALRDGSHDQEKPSDTDSTDPEEWFEHFKTLLGKTDEASEKDVDIEQYIRENYDSLSTEFDQPFTKDKLKKVIHNLKNNKSSSFDLISNEMLKAAFPNISESLLLIFNTILESNFFPKIWKLDILGPLHKSGVKDDPGNFRGINISSCLGKTFCSLLRNRLEKKCNSKISKFQISGKVGARTSDHLLLFKDLVEKYVKKRKKGPFCGLFRFKKKPLIWLIETFCFLNCSLNTKWEANFLKYSKIFTQIIKSLSNLAKV